jgi:hypothetical protein
MGDPDGPILTEHIYEQLLSGGVFDLNQVAYALDGAVAKLRRKGVPSERWATFIHMGA